MFRWLKNYLPRGLYGRAALILILPVLLLQLVVSADFVRRHFEGVTSAMTDAALIDLTFVVETVEAADSLAAARLAMAEFADPLEIVSVLPADAIPDENLILWDDLTAGWVISALQRELPDIVAVSLVGDGRANIWTNTRHGVLEMEIDRSRLSPRNPHQLIVFTIFFGALVVGVAYVFLRNQLRPIKRMARAATDYGKGRITPFNPTGAVEVRAAGMAFLDMRNRLERQTQSRTMMLSGVSHDLRTPLTRLRLGLSLIDHEDVDPLLRDVDDMERLLDAFLDFARSEALDNLEPTNPSEIVNAVLADAERAGQALSLAVTETVDDFVDLRPLAIRRALDNLVGNALRYGKTAQIGVSASERTLRFWVEDDGPGIPPDKREAALSPFVRLDPARNQDQGSGVGLGLSIVADIARSHGGVLRLSESEGLGGLKAELVLAR